MVRFKQPSGHLQKVKTKTSTLGLRASWAAAVWKALALRDWMELAMSCASLTACGLRTDFGLRSKQRGRDMSCRDSAI